MKKAFRKSLKRQASLGGYFKNHHSKGDSYSTSNTGIPILWQALRKKYQFNYPKDWYRIEAHWLDQIESFQEQPIDCPGRDVQMNNAITRVSQCNESYQLCNSLPRSFIVPKDLKDVTLTDSMSTVIKDHRVPIISYCCPIEYRRNFIIRCASSDQQARVVGTLNRVVKPLRVFNLSTLAPNLETVESAHKKLRDACRPKEDDQATNFISKSGKWLSLISLALKIAKETAKTLSTEASVILIEDDDRGWNSVISSLVQVLLEPHRRTIEGYESLISKEWIYLAGGQPDYSQPDTLFTLFLDCTYQIYLQNVSEFEFTSEYLRYLFDAQYIYVQSSTSSLQSSTIPKDAQMKNNPLGLNNNNYHSQRTNGEDFEAKYKSSSINMADLNLRNGSQHDHSNPKEAELLESGYNIFMFSPFYKPDKDSQTVDVFDHVANMKLWSSLYLRWMQPKITYGCVEEILYIQLNK